jgi:hypothetical protein
VLGDWYCRAARLFLAPVEVVRGCSDGVVVEVTVGSSLVDVVAMLGWWWWLEVMWW